MGREEKYVWDVWDNVHTGVFAGDGRVCDHSGQRASAMEQE